MTDDSMYAYNKEIRKQKKAKNISFAVATFQERGIVYTDVGNNQWEITTDNGVITYYPSTGFYRCSEVWWATGRGIFNLLHTLELLNGNLPNLHE